MKNIYKILLTTIFTFLSPFSLILGKELIIGGENIGIDLEFDNILISGTYDVLYNNKRINPADNDILKGDYIEKVDNIEVNSSKELISYFNKLNKTTNVTLDINRDNKKIKRQLLVIKEGNSFKTGLMIKDHILGIGTLTFIDPSNNTYAALGHEIIDSISGDIVDITSGTIYESTVTGIKPSNNGNPGEKIASINKNEVLGNIKINSIYGIYGEINEIKNEHIYESASFEDIKLGKAYIYTVIDGCDKDLYEIEITKLEKQDEFGIKGISFEITDEKLLKKTNGIIQGMSGSPIIQNNYLIGAVTHVVVSDVNKGYGIYIDNMLRAMEELN